MSSTLITPIGEDEFSRFLTPFAPFGNAVALAVSGGPDSMALAYCMQRWGKVPCVALIVEHGLRPESSDEALLVKERLKTMGIQAEILPWTHEVLSGRVHEKARAARYGLLTEACHRLGADCLMMAHHMGDQAETVLMRLAKGSGIDGLAGIAPETQRDGLRLIRPFLAVTKERLIETCAQAGVAYVIDPSNAREKYARGRLRKVLPLLESEGLTVESLAAMAARVREAKEALDQVTKNFLLDAAKPERGGSVCVNRQSLITAPKEIAIRALSAGLRYLHDSSYPPEYGSLILLYEAVREAADDKVQTLYGCLASVSEKKVVLMREPSAASEVLSLSSGQTVLWDGRWFVFSGNDAFPAEVRALGCPPHELVDRLAPDLRRKIPQGRVRASLPGIWDGGTLRAIPSFEPEGTFRMKYRKEAFP